MALASMNILGSELYDAAIRDDVSYIESLRSDKSLPAPSWDAMLDAAVIGGAAEAAAYSLERGATVDNLVLGNFICSPCEPIYRLFVNSGVVKINDEVDRWGFPLGIDAGQGLHSRVQYLLERGARPDVNIEFYGGMNTLAVAALRSDTEMIDLLVRHGAVVKSSGAIVVAAREGKLSMVSSLLEAGADVDELGVRYTDERSVTSMGTPLHKSVKRGHLGIVAALLDAGADINVRDGQGKDVIDIACGKRASNETVVLLEHALVRSAA
ncbi:hypothetical protein B0A48_09688 [Cryoendolithus antarcticus]|uniref:Uncharacterized protein n=1 Tax=Cryoendolithus antarcticus TaxID=1507870 RepID=A0A1V8T0A5_9PEZI|nr:hypothetical protein B0A48_09688 [Cryoendolithus antarcticus]